MYIYTNMLCISEMSGSNGVLGGRGGGVTMKNVHHPGHAGYPRSPERGPRLLVMNTTNSQLLKKSIKKKCNRFAKKEEKWNHPKVLDIKNRKVRKSIINKNRNQNKNKEYKMLTNMVDINPNINDNCKCQLVKYTNQNQNVAQQYSTCLITILSIAKNF